MKRGAAAAALLAAVIAAALLAGCRKREAATAPAVEIDRSGKSATIRTAGGTGALPSSFPKEIPMYPGAHLAASAEARGAAAGDVVTIESPDWPDDIAKFYQAKLSGWKAAMDMKTADARTLILRSPGGKRTLTLSATREALKTVATLTVAGK